MVDAAVHSPSVREKIAVIGGGIGGCLTALMLARVTTTTGTPRFDVDLIEAQESLLNGASLIASRLHLGGEYPLDPTTGLDCLGGAVIGNLTLPLVKEHLFTDARTMKFMVAKETEAEGHLTHRSYFEYYNGTIRPAYEKLFQQVQAAKGWTRSTTARTLFGVPDEGVFCRELSAREIEKYPSVAGGFQTQEPGFSNIYFLSAVELALENLVRQGNLRILTDHKVKKHGIAKSDKGYDIYFEAGMRPVAADQVVQAAWDRGPEISALPAGQSVTVYNRAMLYIDIERIPEKDPYFVMLGKHGMMYCPLNDKVALLYLPSEGAAYRGGDKVLTAADPSVPDHWPFTPDKLRSSALTDEERKGREKDLKERQIAYHKLAVERAPWLGESLPLELSHRNTLNFQKSLEQRRHEATSESAPGLVIMYPTKATLAARSAIEATEIVMQRSARGAGADLIDAPSFAESLEIAISGRYSLKNIKKNLEGALWFGLAHPDCSKYVLGQRDARRRMVRSPNYDDVRSPSAGDAVAPVRPASSTHLKRGPKGNDAPSHSLK